MLLLLLLLLLSSSLCSFLFNGDKFLCLQSPPRDNGAGDMAISVGSRWRHNYHVILLIPWNDSPLFPPPSPPSENYSVW